MDNKREIKMPEILLSGDKAVLVKFSDKINEKTNKEVTGFVIKLKKSEITGITDIIPAFCSVLVNYDPGNISYSQLHTKIEEVLSEKSDNDGSGKRVIEIPVCYGGCYGEDLEHVAAHAGLTQEQVIDIHSSRDYLIYMLGFMPGFPYLGGLDSRIFTPRLKTPRISIPAGSVGIGGEQTGIYPLQSPGGWKLIGRTPVRPYRPEMQPAIIYEAGDYIRFVPVSEDEYEKIRQEDLAGKYKLKVHSI